MTLQKRPLIDGCRHAIAGFLGADQDALTIRVFECLFTTSFLAWIGRCLFYWREWLTAEGFHLNASELASIGYPEPWPLLQPWMVAVFGTVTAGAGVLFMLNRWRRLSALLVFGCALYAQRVDFMSAYTLNKLFVGVYAVLALAPAMTRDAVTGRLMQSVAPLRVIQATLVLQYFAAGLAKMDGDWLTSGYVLWGHVQGTYRTDSAAWALRTWPLWVWPVLQHTALFFEVTSPLLFTIRRLRPVAFILGLGFHLVIAFMMRDLIFFSVQMWAFYALFISPSEWRSIGAFAKRAVDKLRALGPEKKAQPVHRGVPARTCVPRMTDSLTDAELQAGPEAGEGLLGSEGVGQHISVTIGSPRASRLTSRRVFLTAAGVTLAVPLINSVSRRFLKSRAAVHSKPWVRGTQPMRMVCIGNAFGFYPPAFWPKNTGADYDLPSLLQPLEPHQDDFTLFSGLDHGVKGGHWAISSYLSGVRSIDAKWLPEHNMTLDQLAAESMGGTTRFPSLAVGSQGGLLGGCLMSWTRGGTRVPPIPGPQQLFRKLFVSDSASERFRTKDRLDLQGSILDTVLTDAKALQQNVGARDREKLDEYFTSVREVEKQLELSKRWSDVPKPPAGMKEPEDTGLVSDLPVLYDLIALALQTDSTRIATLEIAGGFESAVFGLRKDYHSLSHHGQVKESIDGLLKLETYQTEQLARFIRKLKSIDDGDGALLDHTMVLFGSGMGNANAHNNHNLPIILSGGGFRHGEHRDYAQAGPGKQPLCNLYATMLQRFGVEVEKFGTGTGTLTNFA